MSPLLKQYTACTLPLSSENNPDALSKMRYVSASPTHATLPPIPNTLATPSIFLNISHDGSFFTRCCLPSMGALLFPFFATLVRKWSSGSDLLTHYSWKKLTATNSFAITVFQFLRATQQDTMYLASSSTISSSDAVAFNQRLFPLHSTLPPQSQSYVVGSSS